MMWFEKQAGYSSYLKYIFKKDGIKVGFCPDLSTNSSFLGPYVVRYNNVMASTRLRVNDIIYYSLENTSFSASFYNPLKRYDILVFQKNFSKKAQDIAKRYRNLGSKTLFDINVNYFDRTSKRITAKQHVDIIRFIEHVDKIITTTEYIKDFIIENGFFSDVECIPEIVSDHFFQVKKDHLAPKGRSGEDRKLKLVYVGYADKASELDLIGPLLENLNKKHGVTLLTICERRPSIKADIPIDFVRYDQRTLPSDLIDGDIFIAPRDLEDSYNLGHSLTKIAYPMSVGLPVVASPIRSYLKTPALICKNDDDWNETLELLITDRLKRKRYGELGARFCRSNLSKEAVMKSYEKLFKGMV